VSEANFLTILDCQVTGLGFATLGRNLTDMPPSRMDESTI
jgi:hypothetical protein